MRARLHHNYYVEVCEDSVGEGGSFRDGPGGVYAYSEVPLGFFHKKLLSVPNPHYIDIGANTGAFTLLAAHVPGAFVLAFEPNDEVVKVLRTNIALNNVEANTYPMALWHETGTIGYHPYYGQHGYSRVAHSFPTGGLRSCVVPTITLDSFVSTSDVIVDFLKIDVEGAELMVLDGGTEFLIEQRPSIMMEWHPPNCEVFGYHPSEIDSKLSDLGYVKEKASDTWAYYEYQERKDDKERRVPGLD